VIDPQAIMPHARVPAAKTQLREHHHQREYRQST
jgi:hypothetical protein